MQRPKIIKTAFALYITVILLNIISSAISAGALPEGQSVTVFIIAGAVFTALFLWLGYLIYQGRNWARILFISICLIGFFMTYGLQHEGMHHDAAKYLTWLQSMLTLTIITLLLTPQSNLWFKNKGVN